MTTQTKTQRETPWGFCYTLERKRIKNINLRVKADGQAYISAPMKMPLSVIEKFLFEKQVWIQNALARVSKRQENRAAPLTQEEEKELRRAAQKLFPLVTEKMFPLLSEYKIPYPEIKIRKMKSRWGSCMPQKAIVTYNLYLAQTPPECVEYVALHELCHLVEGNHSPRFYALLQSLMPDWQKRRELLRQQEKMLPR